MSGKLKQGCSVVGGVVDDSVKKFYDSLVDEGLFESRSKAVAHALNQYAESHHQPKATFKNPNQSV